MATDFSYQNKTIQTSGPVKPGVLDSPLDPRTRVEHKVDISKIPCPYVGMKIFVKSDESYGGKPREYVVLSLKPNRLGIPNTVIDKIVSAREFLDLENLLAHTHKMKDIEDLPKDLATKQYVLERIQEFIKNIEFPPCQLTPEQEAQLSKVPELVKRVNELQREKIDSVELVDGVLRFKADGYLKASIPLPTTSNFKAICGTFVCGQGNVGQGVRLYTEKGKYIPTKWIDNQTPVNAQNMNKIEIALEETIDTLSNLGASNIAYETASDPNITTIQDALDKLLYVALVINLSASRGIVEKGEVIDEVVFNWSYNKSIVSQSFDNVALSKDVRSLSYTNRFSTNKTFTLKANDGKSTFSKAVNVTFLNGRYWGVSSSTDYNNELIKGLNKELNESRNKTFTVNSQKDQYIYYCIPSRLGTPTFTVGGFMGGFSKVATIQYENNFGYIEPYDIWKSDNHSLGNTTVVVG